MSSNRCLYCYQELTEHESDFHERCSRKFFGTAVAPVLNYDNDEMQTLAQNIVSRSIAVTGVQPKLSLTIERTPNDPKRSRLTIVGLWGNYILKPPTKDFQHLPENEDLTMHLSVLFGIPTAEHSLIRMKSGELAYITKRFDREKNQKLALEDMCQLTETLTENKYRSSMEKIGKHIAKYSSRPGLDSITFFEIALFSLLTGNSDMHLKNFALLTSLNNEIILAPAFDLVSTHISMPDDKDEMALTINGKNRKLKKSDFDILGKNLGILPRALENTYARFEERMDDVKGWIASSFLSKATQSRYHEMIEKNAKKIFG